MINTSYITQEGFLEFMINTSYITQEGFSYVDSIDSIFKLTNKK